MCNIIEWEDHVGCEHDDEDKVGKFNQTICLKRKYRFLKEQVVFIFYIKNYY